MTSHGEKTEILVLGPIVVRLNGENCPIGATKQQALLARLLAARGNLVPVFDLCHELWDDRTPRDPVHALQARISRLRQAVPSLQIEQVASGYRLSAQDIDTDITRFERLREDAQALLKDGALAVASARLHEALELWRGPAFGGFTGMPTLQAEAVRLDKLWASAMEDCIDIDLALGKEAELIPEFAAVVEEFPLFERFRGQLMIALYRNGQVQEALEVFAQARKISSELYGAEPNVELGDIHMRILRAEPSESLLRIPLATQIQPQSEGTSEQGSAPEANMTSNDAAVLLSLANERKSVIVTGAAGIGKTHVLRSAQNLLRTKSWYAPLVTGSSLSESMPLGAFMGVSGSLSQDWRTPADVISSFVRHSSSTALLVDNVGLLDDSSVYVVSQLIRTAGSPVIITARSLTSAPEAIRDLYDSGELIEIPIHELSGREADELATAIAGGPLTPDTRLKVLDAAAGNPLRLREIISGSKVSGRMELSEHGWELLGQPTPSPRLAQLAGALFDGLDQASIEGAILVAIAGELPSTALDASVRRTLARADVLALSENGCLRLADPMHREILRSRCPEVLWNELTREAFQVLTSELASGLPQAKQQANLLALDIGEPVDVPVAIEIASKAIGSFNERLALRAARAVIAQSPHHVEAHRIAGVAASILRMPDIAEAFFENAYEHANSDREHTDVALDHARHFGLRRHDPVRALAIIDEAVNCIECPISVAHLKRAQTRWLAVAGIGGDVESAPQTLVDATSAMGLITVGVAGVITGPLVEAYRMLAKLQSAPQDVIDLVPGGESLVVLTEIMAESYSGDLASSQQMLRRKIVEAHAQAPESLGDWEYALAFTEMLSGDITEAYELVVSAVEHLAWRDSTGLLSAAQALRAAGAAALGTRNSPAEFDFDAISVSAANDPKVVMMSDWAEARSLRAQGLDAAAARVLVETSRWLLEVQHNYFAGMWAHYAMRTGHEQEAAYSVVKEAYALAGGGFLSLLLNHAEAYLAEDWSDLNEIADVSLELGLTATAADSWIFMAEHSEDEAVIRRVQSRQSVIEEQYGGLPSLALWAPRTLTHTKLPDEARASRFSLLP